MKRVLSWFALVVCFTIFYYAQSLFWKLFLSIFNAILNFSEILFWVLVVCESATALGFIIIGIVACSHLIVQASQSICASRKGIRYILLGIAYLLWYVFLLVGFLVGFAVTGNLFAAIAECLTMIVFCVIVTFHGRAIAADAKSLAADIERNDSADHPPQTQTSVDIPVSSSKHTVTTVCIVLLALASVVLGITSAVLFASNRIKDDQYSAIAAELETTKAELAEKYNELLEVQADFTTAKLYANLYKSYNNSTVDLLTDIVFYLGYVNADNTKYYHIYGCPDYMTASSYYAHNVEYCRWYGYRPCPTCQPYDPNESTSTDQVMIKRNIQKYLYLQKINDSDLEDALRR